ncbi:ChuX/HutX family heme-like substrate-binding protein [Terrimicrobium sacchariphilum]|nr:ChuX/HutX family heme-like substrate-binding protein [Terrimicrobium sacchariphilum]
MSSDRFPLHRPAASRLEGCCEINRQLMKAVSPTHIRVRGARMEVSLHDQWPQMLYGLKAWGEVLVITRNGSAVLGQTREYPELRFSHDFIHARSPEDAFDMDFPPFHSARLVVEERGEHFAYYVEFLDGRGDVLHKVCTTNASDMEQVLIWTEFHQGLSRPDESPMAALAHRWRRVQQRHWFGIEEAEEVQENSLSLLLLEARKRRFPIRLMTGNEGVVQAATMIPQRLVPSNGWMFCSDDTTGLHYDPETFGSLVVHHLSELQDHPPVSVLKCFDDRGELCLAVAPPEPDLLAEWGSLLNAAVCPR